MPTNPNQVRDMVREGYTRIAEREGDQAAAIARKTSRAIGYSDEQLQEIPDEANLGVGCGNPTAMDTLQPGEVVVDLGSGAGMDAFLAASAVGPDGMVIGIDMTDAMLEKARANAATNGYTNVEFRKGCIENLPLEDESVDAIISNCVINLSPEKDQVYREAYRVLRPGGRIMISDLVLEKELPRVVAQSVEAYIGCVGGASLRENYLRTIEEAGFTEVSIVKESSFASAVSMDDPLVLEAIEKHGLSDQQVGDALASVTSLQIFARK